ncbi:enoyl-CoA hydratase/isomerase family protein [Leifsonia sp. L25]|uniref:enoyl-CoA hydratase/isomerase family protein n=1 Tax=Actinomycetes TaxID=1760 RepID=UPI003D68FCE0
MAAPTTLVVTESADRVVATLNRPEVRNAIDQRMVDELHALCDDLERDPRILILTGSEGVFASGADIAELRERTAADARRAINATIFLRIAELPMPVIAALDGYALGGGAELAYAADFRLGTTRLRIGNPETSLGIIAAAGALWRLPQLVGEPLAAEITMAGRVLNGEEALAAGLVSDLFEPGELLAGAHALADRIAKNDPLATQYTKQVLRAPLSDHPRAEQEAQAVLFESPEKHRRMTEFLERRTR